MRIPVYIVFDSSDVQAVRESVQSSFGGHTYQIVASAAETSLPLTTTHNLQGLLGRKREGEIQNVVVTANYHTFGSVPVRPLSRVGVSFNALKGACKWYGQQW